LDGAFLDFYGVVRGREGSQALSGLRYEAYEKMALHQFQLIIAELLALYPISRLELVHRVGFVPVGHPSLFVRVESPHRQEALRFMEHLIERMKRDVPIWKEDVAHP
jgi:molybdopterin synthase catalytic subunit